MSMRKTPCTALAALALVALAGCGDSGGYTPPSTPPVATNEVPPSATASVAAYVNYLDTLPRSDTGEPLSIDNATPPVADTAEPLAPT